MEKYLFKNKFNFNKKIIDIVFFFEFFNSILILENCDLFLYLLYKTFFFCVKWSFKKQNLNYKKNLNSFLISNYYS
jgi:hypothetical protein